MLKQPIENYFDSKHPIKTTYRILELSAPRILLYTIVFFIKQLPVLVSPIYLQYMIAIVKDPQAYSLRYFWTVNIIFLFIILQNLPNHLLFAKLVQQRIRTMEYKTRESLIRKLQQLSISFHTKTKSGQLQSKVLRDVENIVQLATNFFYSGLGTIISLIWSFGIAFYSNWIVGIFFLICTPISALLIRFFRKKMAENNKIYREKIESMNSQLSEMINSITISRAHAIEETEIAKADKHFSNIYKAGMNVDMTNQLFGASTWIALKITITSVIMFTSFLVYRGEMPLENIVLYNGLFTVVIFGIHGLLGFMPIFTRGFDSIRSIGEVIENPDIEWNKGKNEIKEVKGAISFQNISFSFNDNKKIIHNFSLDIKPGECVAFVGHSGAGKSTLMNLIIGFWRPNKGKILLDGIDYSTIDMRSWRQSLAIVPQNTILFSGSIKENITYGLSPVTDSELEQVIEASNLKKMISDLPDGINTYIGENGMTLSGGQRQRVAIARALVRNPSVIILDEATSALDVISEKEVQTAIGNLIKNRTTLIVAHRLSTIRYADKIIVMKNGKLSESGNEKELIKLNGDYAKLKKLQN